MLSKQIEELKKRKKSKKMNRFSGKKKRMFICFKSERETYDQSRTKNLRSVSIFLDLVLLNENLEEEPNECRYCKESDLDQSSGFPYL